MKYFILKTIAFTLLCTSVLEGAVIGPSRVELYGDKAVQRANFYAVNLLIEHKKEVLVELFDVQKQKLKTSGYEEREEWIVFVSNPDYVAKEPNLSHTLENIDLAYLYSKNLDVRFAGNKGKIYVKRRFVKYADDVNHIVEFILVFDLEVDENNTIFTKPIKIDTTYFKVPTQEGISSSGGG